MRLFLAIDLPVKIKKDLSQQLSQIKKEYQDITWVEPENFHITLHFFGEISNYKKIIEKIEEAIYDQDRFYLYSLNVNLFINHKIIFYLGFRREKILEKLVDKIKSSLLIFDKKKFIPHLTFARYRIPSKQQYFVLKKKFSRLNIDINFPVNKIILFQSILTMKKPLYKKIAIFNLIK